MKNQELIDEGFCLLRKWYASQVKKMGDCGWQPLATDRLWDFMVDSLLSAVKHYDGRVPFRIYLGVCVRFARHKAVAWVKAKRRGRKVTLRESGNGVEFDVIDRAGLDNAEFGEVWEEVSKRLSPAEEQLVYDWAERRGAKVEAERGHTRNNFHQKVCRLLKRLRKELVA